MMWMPEVAGEPYRAGRFATIYPIIFDRVLSRDYPECVGELVVLDNRVWRIVAVERFMPFRPIRKGEPIGLAVVEP